MKMDFHSASDLSEILAGVGFRMDISQLSPGALNGSIAIGGSSATPILSIQTDRTLLFRGDRRAGKLPFSLNTTTAHPVVRGEASQPASLHGFQANLSDAFFQMPAGAHIKVALVCQARLERLVTAGSHHGVLELIERSNTAQLNPSGFQQLVELIQPIAADDTQTDLIEAALLEALTPENLESTFCGNLSLRAELMKDLVAWGYANPREAITLNELSNTIFASRSSIVHSCRVTFGVGPMSLLKQIRLGQAQRALSSSVLQKSLQCTTVQEVANYYGFNSRNHFARDYRNQFGEAPSQTLQRASDPGMSCQSVAVAHRPQMAMALR